MPVCSSSVQHRCTYIHAEEEEEEEEGLEGSEGAPINDYFIILYRDLVRV